MKEILVIDIDGTLTNNKDITLKTKQDLEELKSNYHIVFNTGRSVKGFSQLKLINEINEKPYALLNGAIICDSSGVIKKEFVISGNESLDIIRLLSEHPMAMFHVETNKGFFVPNIESIEWDWAKESCSVNPIMEYNNEKTYKIALHLKNGYIPYEKVVTYCRERLEICRIDNDFADIFNKDASKGKAIQIIRNITWGNTPDIKVIACGDSWNDLSMFDVADLSIAVGNDSLPANIHLSDTNALIIYLKKRIQEKELYEQQIHNKREQSFL